MRTALAFVLLLMLTGSIFQSYEHTVDTKGDSVLEKEMDVGIFLGLLEEGAAGKISSACSSDESLGCSFSEGVLVLSDKFSENDGYYSFEASYGIPYVEYELTIRKIPNERFTEMLDRILLAAGLTNTSSTSYGAPLNLQDPANRESAVFLRQSNIDISYAVLMPGEVASAASGEVSGSIEDSRAEFMLSDVLYEAQPIVVKSREINWGYIIFIAAVVVLAAFALSFRKSRKG